MILIVASPTVEMYPTFVPLPLHFFFFINLKNGAKNTPAQVLNWQKITAANIVQVTKRIQQKKIETLTNDRATYSIPMCVRPVDPCK